MRYVNHDSQPIPFSINPLIPNTLFGGGWTICHFSIIKIHFVLFGCATMRERPESVESPGTYVTK